MPFSTRSGPSSPWSASGAASEQPLVVPSAEAHILAALTRAPGIACRRTQSAFAREAALVWAQNRIQRLAWETAALPSYAVQAGEAQGTEMLGESARLPGAWDAGGDGRASDLLAMPSAAPAAVPARAVVVAAARLEALSPCPAHIPRVVAAVSVPLPRPALLDAGVAPSAAMGLPSRPPGPRLVAVVPRRMPPMRHMAVGADAQLHPVAAEHEDLEDDVARLGDRRGEEQEGSEEQGGKARHGAGHPWTVRTGASVSSMSCRFGRWRGRAAS